jgi:hypothetical protein
MARAYQSNAPHLVMSAPPVKLSSSETQPAFRQYTSAVDRGAQYAIAAVEFDAQHELRAPDGSKLPTAINNADLIAFATWLRYIRSKREVTT